MASFQSLKNPELAAQLKSFIAEKEAQANAATNKMPSEFQALFVQGGASLLAGQRNRFRLFEANGSRVMSQVRLPVNHKGYF